MSAAYAIGALLGAEFTNLLLAARREADREREDDENEDDNWMGLDALRRSSGGG